MLSRNSSNPTWSKFVLMKFVDMRFRCVGEVGGADQRSAPLKLKPRITNHARFWRRAD